MIKLFEQYKEYDQVKSWLDRIGINNYIINDDLIVDVDNNINISNMELTEIPIQFGKVTGAFDCSNNKLTSLKGCPSEVGWFFDCCNNKIESLIGSPRIVDSTFTFVNNKVKNLEGAPDEVGGNFICRENQITTLKWCPGYLTNVNFLRDNPLPYEILDFEDMDKLVMHQDEYGIWNGDGSFNKKRFEMFRKEYKKI